MRALLLLFALAACDGGTHRYWGCELCDSHIDAPTICNPVSQVGCSLGEKCTWIVDQTTPQYVGHSGCVPDGTAAVGAACMYGAAGATGYDNCTRGAVCSAFAQPGSAGVCEQICDNQGGIPMCNAMHGCVAEPPLFSTGATSPAAAGVCETACDPLTDNDFDGSGSALTRTGSACGSAADVGCYGLPSAGTPPMTVFTCMPERNYTRSLRHRAECTIVTGCADASDGSIYVNSCNQGYEPLLRESTSVSTAVCVAFCKPLDCYAGNCGSSNANRLGAAPHRCTTADAVGTFGSDEECEYLWAQELNAGQWLPSQYSDAVGICVDHAAYGLPSCATLPLHGSGSGYDAVKLGCVSSQTAGLP